MAPFKIQLCDMKRVDTLRNVWIHFVQWVGLDYYNTKFETLNEAISPIKISLTYTQGKCGDIGFTRTQVCDGSSAWNSELDQKNKLCKVHFVFLITQLSHLAIEYGLIVDRSNELLGCTLKVPVTSIALRQNITLWSDVTLLMLSTATPTRTDSFGVRLPDAKN